MVKKISAKIVETKSGKKGYVYNDDPILGKKVKVRVVDEKYIETGEKILCSPENLKLIGFKD
ncbi:MAG: hypothetical protein AABY15_01865 [Nanoarchaeota archaeon]